jgi:hypothetical protein
MLKAGKTDAEIAAFIRDHVKIVEISLEECKRLDSKSQLGLRQKMPDGWEPGGDVFARLKVANIEWVRTGEVGLP